MASLQQCLHACRMLAPITLVAACGLHVVGSAPNERETTDAAAPPSVDALGKDALDSSVTPEPAASDATNGPIAVLTVTRQEPPALVDLASEGTLDWVHWGRAGQRNEKVSGDGIGEYTIAPAGLPREFAENTTVRFAWSGGTPTAAEPGTNTYSYLNDADGIVATIPIDASTTKRTARLYVGGKTSRVRFELSLTDDSAPPPPPIELEDDTGSFLTRLVVVFAAATDGAKLQAKCSLLKRFTSDASVRIAAVTLSDGEAE
jgi:hypothetical protein